MVTSNAKVGGPGGYADGAEQALRTERDGELVAMLTKGKYFNGAKRKRSFYSYTTAQTLTASNTTYTGHVIWNSSNQTGTGVLLVLNKVGLIVSVTSASMTGIALGISTGQTTAPTGTTAATQVGSLYIGDGSVAQGLSYKAATLAVAGTPIMPLVHNTAAINTVGADLFGIIDLEGAVIIPPGFCVELLALGAASAASAVTCGFWWEEVPV